MYMDYYHWKYYRNIANAVEGSAMFIPKRSTVIKNKRRNKR